MLDEWVERVRRNIIDFPSAEELFKIPSELDKALAEVRINPLIEYGSVLEILKYAAAKVPPGIINLRVIELLADHIESKLDDLRDLFDLVRADIKIEVVPDKDIPGPIYFDKGVVIFPLGNPERYHGAEIITYNCGSCRELHPKLKLLTPKGGADNLESAQKMYTNPKALETILIASNTQKYHLKDTVFPVIEKHYHEAIKQQK